MKKLLDSLVLKYENKDFIKNDPIQFPHRYTTKEDVEISAFIASLFAFGRREQFIKKLNFLFGLTQTPFELIKDFKKFNLGDFIYRFIKSEDLTELLKILNKLYIEDKSSLEELFSSKDKFNTAISYFYSNCNFPSSRGFCFMFAKPCNNSALKRINMFLRWMARTNSPVDFGIWKNIKPSELIIPLDTHVARISRKFNLLKRKQNDFKSALELTQKLKEFDEKDPVKYDFALFGLGIDKKINF